MIEIKECGEPLVDIKKICPDLVIDLGSSRPRKEKIAYLRKTVAKMLCQARNYLPKDMTFVIGDAWRPQYVQEKIFQEFLKDFAKRHPSWSKVEIIKEVEKYVAPFEGKHVSGHMTGGAVDLRLWKSNRKVSMKSSKLTYQENAKSCQPKLPPYIQKNRKIMFDALRKVSFSNYPEEFWHWSYGDIWWAKRNPPVGGKKVAIYGVIKQIKRSG